METSRASGSCTTVLCELKSTLIAIVGSVAAACGAALLSACGGSGSSGSTDIGPTGLSYPTVTSFVIHQKITDLTPTVIGTVNKYSVTPSLPIGLELNTTTGVILGTPVAITPVSTYTITAANDYGSTTAKLTLEVDDLPPRVAYASNHYSFTNQVEGQTDLPVSSGGKVVSWSISPALPAGLTLESRTGVINGVPSVGSVVAPYVVTGTNSGGTSQFTVTIAVAAAPLLDLGHAGTINILRFVSSTFLSQDLNGHWALWNFANDKMLASGNSPNGTWISFPQSIPKPVNLVGSTVVIETSAGLEIRAAADGSVLAEIPATVSWWQLASDGSYVCAGNSTTLTAWSTTGQVLFSHAGNYSNTVAFAAPMQVQVARGPAGASVIQTLAIPTGATSVSPAFLGSFQSWFVDGGRFLTTVPNNVWIYSSAAVQQEFISLPSLSSLAGEGSWFWAFDSSCNLNIYAVGSNSQPVGTFSVPGNCTAYASGNAIGLLGNSGQIEVIDLSGANPVTTIYSVPGAGNSPMSAFAATTSSRWIVGDNQGVLVDGSNLPAQARYLDYGRAVSIAGSATNIAIATASGRILYYDMTSHSLQTTINFSAGQVSLSNDGSVLAAGVGLSGAINVYTMPAATLVSSFTYPSNEPQIFGLSGSGTTLALIPTLPPVPPSPPGSTCYAQVVAVMGGSQLWCDNTGTMGQVQLSPDGTLIAVSANVAPYLPGRATQIYKNGILATAVAGWVVGWLDDSRLLTTSTKCATTLCISPIYAGSTIYDSTGTNLSSPALPPLASLQALSPTSMLGRSGSNAGPGTSTGTPGIYSEITGATLWLSGSQFYDGYSPGPAAAAGTEIVFQNGNLILAEPY